jgi:hypothetical protein
VMTRRGRRARCGHRGLPNRHASLSTLLRFWQVLGYRHGLFRYHIIRGIVPPTGTQRRYRPALTSRCTLSRENQGRYRP